MSEVICRSGRRYLLCQSVDYVYVHDPDTLEVFDVFSSSGNLDDKDREDCQKAWGWLEKEILNAR